MASNLNKFDYTVQPTAINPRLGYEDMSPLGKKLYDIANEIEHSDDPAPSESEIQKELRERRDGFDWNDTEN